MRSTRRTGVFDWHSTERNAEKSCSPISTCAAGCMAVDVERPVNPGGARGAAAPIARCDSRCSSDRCGGRPCGARESPASPRRPTAGRWPAAAGCWRRAPRRAACARRCVSKWMTCPMACTPPSVRPAQMAATGCPATKDERGLDRVLNGYRVCLRLPAGVVACRHTPR